MSENTRELEKKLHAFSLRLIDGITKKLSLSVYTRKLERNCTLMPLEHIDCINDELSVSIYFRELEKKLHFHATGYYRQNHQRTKISWTISVGGFCKISGLIEILIF
jgi:hypothetical protein